MRVSIPYGTIVKTLPQYYDETHWAYEGKDRDVRAYEWQSAKEWAKLPDWFDKACALVFAASAFVALLTRGRYHVLLRVYDWESNVA